MSNSVAAFELNSNFGISGDDGGISSKDDGVFLQNLIGDLKDTELFVQKIIQRQFLMIMRYFFGGACREFRLKPCQKNEFGQCKTREGVRTRRTRFSNNDRKGPEETVGEQ